MRRFSYLFVVMLTVSASSSVLGAGRPQAVALAPTNAPRSQFNADPGFGRDPFFPNSSRFKAVVRPVEPEAPRGGIPDFVALKGISVVGGKKLAIINNYTVAEGEDFSLRFGTQSLKIKLIEVKERSAIIRVNEVDKEIFLRPGFN